MPSNNRDDFTKATKIQIAKRAGYLCSVPWCRQPTEGSNSAGTGEISIGTAAHICAAAPKGPRYDPKMTPDERKSSGNGIWMCRDHGSSVDAGDPMFTVELLRGWQAQAQKESWQRVMKLGASSRQETNRLPEGARAIRLREAAYADLQVFHRSNKWPSPTTSLTLQVDGLCDSISTAQMAAALTTIDNLVLVAPPGMGKTTALFQVAEEILARGGASPIVIPLADWSTDTAPLFESILKRSAFRGISEEDLRLVAAKPGVILLLDGWNELDNAARKRATAQVERLQMELPEVGLLISTRKQSLDIPIRGRRITILPLNKRQQFEIAYTLRGETGKRVVEHARRTPGVRDLAAIPLYLTALLALPEGGPFPTTKEELLRRFVIAHEGSAQQIEALSQVTHGCHQRYLEDLAIAATSAANTTLIEAAARSSVSRTNETLAYEGQISDKPQPNTVLEALVNHHVLIRIVDPPGYSFQHQQCLSPVKWCNKSGQRSAAVPV